MKIIFIVKTPNRNERKHLPKIENETQLWTNLHLMCKVFEICENLFQKSPIGEKNLVNKHTKINTISSSIRSESIDSASLKQSFNENLNNEEANLLNGTEASLNSNKCKRRSLSLNNQFKFLFVNFSKTSFFK